MFQRTRKKTAKNTRRKRTRTDIPLLILRPIRRSIVRRRKIKTSIEKARPAAKTSIAMKRRKIVIDTTKTSVRHILLKSLFVCSAFALLCLIVVNRISAKHRDDKEKKEKEKEEIKVKEESLVKTNHTINEGFHYNLNIKTEMKEVRYLPRDVTRCALFKENAAAY